MSTSAFYLWVIKVVVWVDTCFSYWIIQTADAALVKDSFCIFWKFCFIALSFNSVKYISFYKAFKGYLCVLSSFMVSTCILNSCGNFLLIKLYFGIVLKQAVTSKYFPFHHTFWQYLYLQLMLFFKRFAV